MNKTKRRGPYGPRGGGEKATQDHSHQQAGFALGYLYRGFEQELDAFGAAHGGTISVGVAAQRVGKILLTKARGLVLDGTEHMPEVRGATARAHAFGPGEEKVHVRPRHRRALKSGRRAWRKEEISQFKSLRKKGLTVPQIAAKLGRPITAVNSAVYRLGLKPKQKRKLSDKQLTSMRANAALARQRRAEMKEAAAA